MECPASEGNDGSDYQHGRRQRSRQGRCDGGQQGREPLALCRPRGDPPQGGARPLPPLQVGDGDRPPRHLLHFALAALDQARRRAGPGHPHRHGQPPLLFLLHRDLAAGILLHRGPAHHGRRRPVPRHLPLRPRLVRLCLPADGVDRPLHLGREQGGGRPQRPHQARRRALERLQAHQARRQDVHLAADRHRDRRLLGVLLRRRPHPVP